MVLIGLYLFRSTTKTLDTFDNKKEKTQLVNSQKLQQNNSNSRIILDNSDFPEKRLCYTQIWVNDGVVTYKLNNGNYAYNPSYLIERCSRSFVQRTDKNLINGCIKGIMFLGDVLSDLCDRTGCNLGLSGEVVELPITLSVKTSSPSVLLMSLRNALISSGYYLSGSL